MITEYVSFKPPRVAAVKMVSGPFFIETFVASWNFKDTERGTSLITFIYDFEPTRLFKIFEFLFLIVFRREMQNRLIALKKACEDCRSEI
jgi:ribosome-associated toxin RatA of RatAB toxin-antitoxin module